MLGVSRCHSLSMMGKGASTLALPLKILIMWHTILFLCRSLGVHCTYMLLQMKCLIIDQDQTPVTMSPTQSRFNYLIVWLVDCR